jgi:hypothetical protein
LETFCCDVPRLSVSSATVASPSRRRSRILIRIGSPITRKRRAISSTIGSGRGWGRGMEEDSLGVRTSIHAEDYFTTK